MYLTAEGEFYGTAVRDYVAVPVPEAEVIHVVSEGEILASAYRHKSGRYTRTKRINGKTLLYQDWQKCLRDQLPDVPGPVLDEILSEGW